MPSMRFISLLMLIALLLTSSAPAQALPRVPLWDDGCAHTAPVPGDNTAALRAFLTAAAVASGRCGVLAAGIYSIQGAAGVLFAVTGDDLTVTGAGAGRTILRFPPKQALTGPLEVWQLRGAGQTLAAFSIIGQGFTGTGEWTGVQAAAGSTTPTIRDLEIAGVWGDAGAGGTGIGLYQPWDIADAVQDAMVEGNYIHDGQGQGVGINSNRNTIRGNRIARMGVSTLQHCVYLQGGYNQITGNTFDSCGGYSIHGYFDVEDTEADGNLITQNVSHNPGEAHVLAQAWAATGRNPRLPAGTPNSRSITISDNTFIDTGANHAYGLDLYVPFVATGNLFVDVQRGDTGAIRGHVAGTFSSNHVTRLVPGPSGPLVSLDGAGSVAQGNVLEPSTWQTGIVVNGAESVISGNTIRSAAPSVGGIQIDAPGVQVLGNHIAFTDPGARWAVGVGAAGDALHVTGNTLHTQGNAWVLFWWAPDTARTLVTGNTLTGRWDQSGPGIVLRDNFGP
jgi:hypothetical protein